MATVSLGSLSLSHLSAEESFLRILRRQLWERIVFEAKESVEEKFSVENQQKALESIILMSKKHTDKTCPNEQVRTLSNKLFRQVFEVEFSKHALASLSSIYPRGAKRKTIDRLDTDRLRIMQKGILRLADILLPVFSAAEGTVFSKVPFSVLISFFYVLANVRESHSVMWWSSEENAKLLHKVAKMAWAGNISEEEKAITKSGVWLFLETQSLFFKFCGEHQNILQLGDDVIQRAERIGGLLRDGHPGGDGCFVAFYNENEYSKAVQNLKLIDAASAELWDAQHQTTLNFASLVESIPTAKRKPTAEERSNINSLTLRTEMTAYFDEEQGEYISSVIPSTLMMLGAKMWASAVSAFASMTTDALLHEHLRALRRKDNLPSRGNIFPEHSTQLVEMLRMFLVMHDSGINVLGKIPSESTVAMFFDRLNADGSLVQPRVKKRRLAAQGQLKPEEMQSSSEDFDDVSED